MQGDVLVDKENVGPRGSAAWSQQAMLHSKNRGLGGAGHDAVRKEKAGVLTSNSTTNNGGGAAGLGSLELLKERVKLLKLSSANGASQDSGARLLKHRSPLVDIKFTEGTVKSTMGGNFSKEGTVYSTADERSSCLSQEVPSFSRPSQHRAVSSERSERILRSNNLHSSGGNIGSKSLWPGKGKGLDMYHESRDRREASRSRVEAWVSGVGQSAEDVVSTSPLRPVSEQHVKASRSFGITLQQTEGEKQVPQSSSNSRDSGGWSGSRRQGTPYKRRLPLLEEEKVGKTSTEDEAERNNNQRHGADDASPLAEVPKHSSQYRQVEYPEVHADKSEDGVKTLDERAVKHLGSQSVDRISDRRTLEMSGRGLSSPGGIRSASIVERSVRVLSEKKVTCSDSSKLTRSSGVWDSGTGWSRQEVVYEKEVSRSTSSYYNVDTTAAAPSVLLSRMTGASSSGSSATPGLSGSSSRDDDTVGCPESSKPTPSSKEHAIPSSRERLVSRTRISKRLKALGPASRVLLSGALRVTVEDDDSGGPKDGRSPSNIMVSPDIQSSASLKGSPSGLNGHSPITPEEAQKSDNAGQVEYDLLLDLKKRKAENDPSIGDISQGDNQSSTGSKSPLGTDAQAILQSASDLLRDVHNNHLRGFNNMLPTCRHSSLKNLEGLGDNVLPTLRRVEQTTSGVEPHLSQISSRRTTRPDSSSDLQPDSKTVLEKVNINKASLPASKQSRGTPGKPHSGLGSPKDLANFDNRQVVEREVAQVKASVDTADRSPGNSSISKSHMTGKQSPSSEVLRRSMEIEGSRILSKRGTSDAKEGSEAVSMSHDALFSKDRSETRPGSIQDLSGSLGSLSIGEKNVLSKSQSRGPLQNVLNASCSNPTVAPVNQSNTKNLEAIGVLPNTSHSGKSAVTSENEPISQGPRSLPFDSSRRGEYGASKDRHANEQKSEASLRPASSGRPEVAASGAHQSGDEVPRENGNGATAAVTQRRVSENAHFFWVNDKRYQKLGKIGKGGSSEVYKVIDSECSIYALKKISLKGRDHASALGFYQEIEYLERLRGKRHIVQLIDYEVTNRFVIDDDYKEEKISEDACIYMVLEFGEIDLAGILSKKRKEMLDTNEPLDDNWLRFYWKHMLLAVKTIHDERIVHADLKPANFLLVKGELKLIDFGIAKAIQNDTTHIVRDAQVGTLNYMSPEAFMTNSKDEEGQVVKCGRSSDIWSLGCILYQMVYGHTPFSQVDSFYAKIQAITSRSYTIDYPPVQDPWLLDVMKKCLTWSRNSRPDIAQLLVHPFLRPDLAQQRYVK